MCRYVSVLLVTITSPCLLAAAPIVHLNPAGEVTGISGLTVGETLYDVDFVVGSFEDLFGPTGPAEPPTFWGDPAGADQASAAIVTALIFGNPDPQRPRHRLWRRTPFCHDPGRVCRRDHAS
jgi:hypothetical protein